MDMDKVEVSENILDKITKLLALAERAGTEGEAVAAMEATQRLLARYNLTLTDIQGRGLADKDPMEVQTSIETAAIRQQLWAARIGQAAAALYFCKYLKSNYYKQNPCGSKTWDKMIHYFVGRRSNAEVARLMTGYLIDTVLRLSKEAGKSSGLNGVRRTRFERDFRDGAAYRLFGRCLAIAAGKSGKPDDSNLPALYKTRERENEEFAAAQFGKTTSRKIRKVERGEGYFEGARAAEGISLNDQIK